MSPAIQMQTAPVCREPSATCALPPADPSGPGMIRNTAVDQGPNDFTLGIDGPDPMLEVGGTHDDREHQRDALLALNARAAQSYVTRGGDDRSPSNADVEQTLDQLDRNPPIGADGREVTHAIYQSTIPNATAQEAYEHFVNNPNEVFNAGGMEIRPPTDRLQDGGRYMLEIGGPPPAWLPIEITLDPANNALTIHTLDGHVLRGEQTFTFTDNCDGGATLTQNAHFQASTDIAGDMQHLASISQGQHEGWQFAHREIFEQFNGDRDYSGMGLGFDPGKWAQFGLGLLSDPGKTVNVGIDVVGEVANETLDSVGVWTNDGLDVLASGTGWIMDRLGISRGDKVEDFIDDAGDAFEDGLDRMGDGASRVADKVGDGAEAVIDFLNPFD